MSGSETGNVLIEDANDRDPRKYGPLKADRAQRIRYPCHVGNLFKNVTEQVYAAAGGTIPSAQFMTGRVYLDTTASGTITLPTATAIVQLLNLYYRQVLALQGPFTNSNSVVNRIVNEIEVEFYNASAAGITLAVGAGTTFVGPATSLVLPATTIARYKFVITATNPAAINMFPVGAPGGGSVVTLPVQAPTQLVDYNPATGQLGYVTNAVLDAIPNAGYGMITWDPATSTIHNSVVATAAPAQLFTRNTTTGQLVSSATANVPNGTVTTIPIGINATTGVLEKVDASAISALSFRSQVAAETVPDAATTIVTYDTATSSAANVSYNAGIFTVTAPGSYIVCVDYAFAAATANTGSYISLRYGSPPTTTSNEVYRSGEIIKNGSFSVPFSADSTFTQFCVTITNAEGGVITLSTGGGGQGIRNAVKVMRVQ